MLLSTDAPHGLELEREEAMFYLDGWFVYIEEDIVQIAKATNGRDPGQGDRNAKTISCQSLALLAEARCKLQNSQRQIEFRPLGCFVDNIPLTKYVTTQWKERDEASAWMTSVYWDMMGDGWATNDQ
jgi:hypothetical protein